MSDSIVFRFIPSDDLYLIADMERKISYITATEIHTDTATKRKFMIFMIDNISFTSETWQSFIIS